MLIKKLLLVLCSMLLLPRMASAAQLVVGDNFEDGPAWQHNNRWDTTTIPPWTIIDIGCHTGRYCAAGAPNVPGSPVADSQLIWIASKHGYNNYSSTFVRFWAKFEECFGKKPCNGTFANNFWRFDTYNVAPDCRATMEQSVMTPWIALTDCSGTAGSLYPSAIEIIHDNQWHEYAILVTYSTTFGTPTLNYGNGSSRDGSIKIWIDGKGTYTDQNAKFKWSSLPVPRYDRFIAVPFYFKDNHPTVPVMTSEDNWRYWVDDVEIWINGIPNEYESSLQLIPNSPTNIFIK